MYNDPGLTSAKVAFVKGIDRNRLDVFGLESSLKYFFFQMMIVVFCVSLPALEDGSRQVMLGGMLAPLFAVPPQHYMGLHTRVLNWDSCVPPLLTGCALKKTSSGNIAKPYTQLSLFACSFNVLND